VRFKKFLSIEERDPVLKDRLFFGVVNFYLRRLNARTILNFPPWSSARFGFRAQVPA